MRAFIMGELWGTPAACGDVKNRIHGSHQQDFSVHCSDFQVGQLKLLMIKCKETVINNDGNIKFSSKMYIYIHKRVRIFGMKIKHFYSWTLPAKHF